MTAAPERGGKRAFFVLKTGPLNGIHAVERMRWL